MNSQDNELSELREKITAVDNSIIESLAKRMDLVEKVGNYKRSHNMEALDETRRDELKKAWIERGAALHLPASLVLGIFELIHKHSVSREQQGSKS